MLDTERYQELLEAERVLNELKNRGIDNWEGWYTAMEEINERI